MTSLVAALTSGGGLNAAIGQQSPMTPFIGQAGPSPGGPNNALSSTATVPKPASALLNEKLALVMREVSASLARQSQHQQPSTAPSPGAGGHSANAAALTPSTTPSSGGATSSSSASNIGGAPAPAPLPNPAASIINAVINQFISGQQQHSVASANVSTVTPTTPSALFQHQPFNVDAVAVPKSLIAPTLLRENSECMPYPTPSQSDFSPAVQQQTPAFLRPDISGLIDSTLLASIQIPESDNYFRQVCITN